MEALPPESLLARLEGTWWTDELELTATGVEVAYEAMRVAMAIGGAKKGKLPRPLRIPRPGPTTVDKPRKRPPSQKRRPATLDEVRAVLAMANRRT